MTVGVAETVAVAAEVGAVKAVAHAGPSEYNVNEQMIKLLRPQPQR
jgi:hypothetical protein